MSSDEEENQLADKFSNYCDPIVAVSFVNALAFFVAILDPDIRCTLIDYRTFVVASGLILQAAYFGAILFFRSGETRLRTSSGGYTSQLAHKFSRRLHITRLVFVVAVAVGLAVLSWHGLVDPACVSS
jgi:hypothetical protein